MKSFNFDFPTNTSAIFVLLTFVLASCEITDDKNTITYHHKIQLDRQFCDSFGNDIHDYYYDSQNKLLRTEWIIIENGTPESEDIQYSGNTILIQSNTYLLDTQNRVVKISRNNSVRSYEYEGNLRVKETFIGEGDNNYVTISKYKNDRLVTDSTIYSDYTIVRTYFHTDTLRPDYMIDDMWGVSELKPKSKYLERLVVNRIYFDGVVSQSVDSVFYTYQIETNRIQCNVSIIETPRRSNNCQEYQLIYALEYPNE